MSPAELRLVCDALSFELAALDGRTTLLPKMRPAPELVAKRCKHDLRGILPALARMSLDSGLTATEPGEPIIDLPPERGQPWRFAREVISNFDAAGPTVYWNNIRLAEHTGTHFDAPAHWLSGKELHDVSQVPTGRLLGPAAVIDMTEEVERDPDCRPYREYALEALAARYRLSALLPSPPGSDVTWPTGG